MATVLDDLSGFEFEEVMVEVFRHQGYREVRQAVRTADEGRDVTMVDDSDPGGPVGVVVECKHTDVVGRPVVQKLHSAVQTHDYDGPCRGIVATTGRFTAPAEEYAERVSTAPDDVDIDLLDGRRLREIGEAIGMDLYSGRIEVLCDETLPPPDGGEEVAAARNGSAAGVANLDRAELPEPSASLAFVPLLLVDTEVDATFETTVGVVHSVFDRERLALTADRDGPSLLREGVARLVTDGDGRESLPDHERMDTDDLGDSDRNDDGLGDSDRNDDGLGDFDAIEIRRYGRTESEYADWVVERQRERYERTVRYTGDNNVTYTKTCTPSASDVRIRDVDPVYVPQAVSTTSLGEYAYDHAFVTNGADRVTLVNEFSRCIHCADEAPGRDDEGGGESGGEGGSGRESGGEGGSGGESGGEGGGEVSVTFCENCGAIACDAHVREERLVAEPVCTGCSVTGEFFFATKHFYDEANREAFAEEYAAMPAYRKPLENPRLTAALVGGALLLLLLAFGSI